MMTVPPNVPAKLERFIGGAHTASADGATFEVADPVTNLPYATVAAGGPADVDRAVAIEARASRIAELETFDTGLPITQARGQAARAAENFRFFADLAVTLHED